MNYRPVPFSGPRVRRLLQPGASQFRLPMRPQPEIEAGGWGFTGYDPPSWAWYPNRRQEPVEFGDAPLYCQVARVGEIVLVREAIRRGPSLPVKTPYPYGATYRADWTGVPYRPHTEPKLQAPLAWCGRVVWQSAAPKLTASDMPLWACRLHLRIDALEVRPLHLKPEQYDTLRQAGYSVDAAGLAAFQSEWDDHRPVPYRWASNPWVWVFTYTVV